MHRPVLIVGGAPKIKIDAVRYLSVHATGRTAVYLHDQLLEKQYASTVLIADNVPCADSGQPIIRYSDRQSLDRHIHAYLKQEPTAVVVMTAAVNDYDLDFVRASFDGTAKNYGPSEKVPSGANDISIHLKPATKLIDRLVTLGHTGPLVACKYEGAESVLESASKLQKRVGADLVLANSLCGEIQALVGAQETQTFASRNDVLVALLERIEQLTQKN